MRATVLTWRQVLQAAASTLGLAAAGSLLGACGVGASASSGASASPAGKPASGAGSPAQSFDQLLEAAKREGQVNLWTGSPNVEATMQKLQDAFNKRFAVNIHIDHVSFDRG